MIQHKLGCGFWSRAECCTMNCGFDDDHRVGQQEHDEVLRAAGIPTESDGGEHSEIMDIIMGDND